MTTTTRRAEAIVLPLLFGVVICVVWSLLVRYTESTVFPTPMAVVRGAAELFRRGLLLAYLRDSLLRVSAGFLVATVLGIPTGLLMGRYSSAATVMNPVIQLLRPISPIAWIPVAIAVFGITTSAAVFLVFLGCFFPIVVSTMNAVASVPTIYLRAGQNFGLSRFALFSRVILPASLPQIMMGLRIALGVGWLVLVAAEMIAVDSGLGYLVLDARNAGKRYDLVVAGMLMIGLTGLVLDTLLRRVETIRAMRWGFRRQ